MMLKKLFILSTLLFCGTAVFAQTAQNNEQLELPDVTAIIDSDTLKAQKDALPDFKDVLEINGESGTVTVQLPDVDNQDTQVEVKVQNNAAEKSIFAEGMICGGYPFLFSGDFSVYRQTGDSPFKISFNHESAAGYSGHALNDGFFDESTSMDLQKTMTHDNFEWNISGAYCSLENGLQNMAADVNSVSQNLIGGSTSLNWTLPKGNSLGFDIDLKDYIRYANASTSAVLDNWVKQTQVFSLIPSFWYSWEGNGFKTGVDADYSLSVYNGTVNRGSIKGNFSWENQFIRFYTDAGLAVSNKMNSKVAVPFTLGVYSSIPVKISSRDILISAEGGITSEGSSVSDFEQKYKFAGFKNLPGETSFWFTNMNFVLPVKDSFTFSLYLDYKSTIWNNGYFEPEYKDTSLTNGLYSFTQKDGSFFYGYLEVCYFSKMFSTSLSLYGNFITIPVTDSLAGCCLNASVFSPNGKWGVDAAFNYKLQAVPELSLSGFVRISSAAKLIAQINDIVYLFNSSSRYYGFYPTTILSSPGYSQYLERNGSASIGLKFNF